MMIEQQGPPKIMPVNLDRLNYIKLDNLIPKRNQFSNLRYEVISESLFFENKKIIDEAVKILQEHQANIRPNEQNDYIPVTAKRFCSQLDQFTFQVSIDKKRILLSLEQKSLLPTAELKQIIQENFSEGGMQVQAKSNQMTPNVKSIGSIIIFELNFQELQEFKTHTLLKQKEEFILKKFKQQIIIENDNFWTNNDFLIKKYQQDVQQVQKDQILILLKGKKIRIEDYIQFFEKDLSLVDKKLVPSMLNQSQIFENVNPMYECTRLHSNQNMLNCIQTIQQLERQSKFDRLHSILSKHFKQLDSFQTFQQLLDLIDHSKQIIKWEHLLKTFFQEYEGYQRLSMTCIQRKSDSNLMQIRNYFNNCYTQLQGRFQDRFYKASDESQLTEFAQAPLFLVNNNVFDQTSGHCAYEIFTNGFLVYFKLAINKEIGKDKNGQPLLLSQKFSCYSLLHYTMNDPLKEVGELGQLILADKDEGIKVIKQDFVLKQQYSDSILIHLTNPETDDNVKQLIIDILLRVVAVRMKRIMFNPQTRGLPNAQRKIEEI